ncbi:MAG: DNA-processing protein DprA [Rhodocyclaceae bacterium]|nr:DNA-processing protein DprA [Rhodocyclaceae bacterium]
MEEDLAAWLKLALAPGLSSAAQRELLKTFGSPDALFAQPHAWPDWAKTLAAVNDEAVAAALAWSQLPGNRILTWADQDYPQSLLTIPDPPLLLYAKGRTELLNRPMLAIVGSRNGSRQGLENATSFAQALAAQGFTIVSGLALGCDAAAHRGALREDASTIAVIGTGCDRIYPAAHAELAREIAEKGCLVSEFPLGTPPLPANFPRRNRIIAGLCKGCLVVEAAKQSGSLITARLAAEFGREVFAIPGSIHSPLAKGCHALIKQGAKLVECAEDVLEELGLPPPPAVRAAPPEEEDGDPVLAALGHDVCDFDTLAERCALSAEALQAHLLALELSGRIEVLPGRRYQRLVTVKKE